MGGHHLHLVAHRSMTGGSVVYSSIRVGEYNRWNGPSPMEGFPDLPITDMYVSARYSISKEELCSDVSLKDPDYVTAEVYRSYSTDEDFAMDLFVRRGDTGRWRLYKLSMPREPPADYRHDADAPYPQPADWYLSTGKRFVRYITEDDWTSARTDDYVDDNSRL